MNRSGTRFALLPTFAAVLFAACNGAAPVTIEDTRDAQAMETGADADAGRALVPCRDCAPFPDACHIGAFCRVANAANTATVFLALHAREPNEVWAAGSIGNVLLYDGVEWAPLPFKEKETFGAILSRGEEMWLGVSLRSSYILGSGLPDIDGGPAGWARLSEDVQRPDDVISINAFWAFPGSDFVWVALTLMPGAEATLARVHRDGARLVRTGIAPSDGHPYSLHAMTGTTEGELWVAGEHGSLYRITEVELDVPLVTSANTRTMTELTGLAEVGGEILATGYDGLIRRFDKNETSPRIEPALAAGSPLRGLHATAPDDVWAVGDEASVFHYDGTSWARVPVAGLGGVRPSFHAVTSAGGRVWIAGEQAIYELRRGDD